MSAASVHPNIDRGRRRRRKNGVKSCPDAATRPGAGRSRTRLPWKLDRRQNAERAFFTPCALSHTQSSRLA
eukprot:3749006-Prymnesium_polylepis.1